MIRKEGIGRSQEGPGGYEMNGIVDVGDLRRGVSLMRKALPNHWMFVRFGCSRKLFVMNILLSMVGSCEAFWKEFMRNGNVLKFNLPDAKTFSHVLGDPRFKAFSLGTSLYGYEYWQLEVAGRINAFLYDGLETCCLDKIDVCWMKKCGVDGGKMLVGFRCRGDELRELKGK